MAWTDFELVRLPVGKIKNAFAGREVGVLELENPGVPRGFFGRRYAVGSLALVVLVGEKRLACFGSTGLKGKICLDPSSGEVVEFLDLERPSPSPPMLVNSSLALFTKTVHAAIERSESASSDEMEEVSASIGEMILRIDQRAMVRDQFWSTFVDDIAIGDFETDSVLARSKAAAGSGAEG